MAFKMKGHTLPGIKQRNSDNLADGRSPSSAFQKGKKNDPPVYKTTNHPDFKGPGGYFKNTAKVAAHKLKNLFKKNKK